MTASNLVKICGVTQENEVDALARLAVNFFGLVVGFNVGHAVSKERAAALIAHAGRKLRGTIVTTESSVDALSRMVEDTGAPAIQLAGFTSARRVSKLRQRFDPERLTIMQVIHFQSGRAAERAYLDAYADAGVDFFILDRVGDDGALGSTGQVIDPDALTSFREEVRCSVPVLVAGGVQTENVRDLMAAAGAAGIDVSSSVRDDSGIAMQKVAALIEAMQ